MGQIFDRIGRIARAYWNDATPSSSDWAERLVADEDDELRRIIEELQNDLREVRVVREISANGYGQVEVSVDGTPLKLAARTNDTKPIPVGAVVKILDRTESVVIVSPQSD